jgi:hypothetical protein
MELQNVIDEMQNLGYEVDTRPYKLNIVGIRNPNISEPENYEDHIAYFYYDSNGDLQGKVAEATTTPSVYWLQNPMSSEGTAIMKQGQYKDAYAIGLHKNKYEALVQQSPITVIRDADRNGILNYFGKTNSGLYGINIHHSTATWASADKIGQDSAGCQVFRFRQDFDEMMNFAKSSKSKYGNNFTYTLIDEREQIQNTRKTAVNLSVIGIALIGITAYIYILYKKKII